MGFFLGDPLLAPSAGGGASFTPASLSPLLWLRASAGVYSDAGVTPVVDGDPVYQWSDQSGNGNDLSQPTLSSRPAWTAGSPGYPTFDGVDDFLTRGTTTALNFEYTQAFTLACWFYPTALAALNNGWVLTKMMSSGSFRGYGLQIAGGAYTTAPNSFAFWLRNDNATSRFLTVRSGNVLADSTQQHLCVTYSGSGLASGVKLYLNGAATAMTTVADALGGSTIISGTNFNSVGRDGGNGPVACRLDQLFVKAAALTATQVGQLFAYGRP